MSVRYAATAYLRRTYALQLDIIDSYVLPQACTPQPRVSEQGICVHELFSDIHCKEGLCTSRSGMHTKMRAAAWPRYGNVSGRDTEPNCLNHSQQQTIQQNSEEYLWRNVVTTTYMSSVAAKMWGINSVRVVHELIAEVSRGGNEVEGEDRTRVSGRMVPAVKSPVRKFIPDGIQMENTP
ncbi:hypothetical protein DFH07DRAFT_790312 [Mycena maculata]|uniref:Uncharacterized protein n=1 Tax=Mycena maculata TaxID=230809 RepID=A0AAD7KFR8_9AGAR|nr:hypothetical protein DFH07DRAFT_790312 [Mycena maculata]